jgi:solute carrier family 25 folate transporter 32
VLASIVCAPLDVLRTRLQVWGDVDVQHRHSKALTVIRQIYQYEGWTGYFRGLGATLITVPLFWSLYFPTYDYLKAHYTTQYPTTPTYLIHCGSAIVAGGLADVVCNPLFVVRTRLQTDALHHARGTLNAGIVATVKDLYQTGGFRIFWRGMTASLFGLSHVAVQFPIYEFLKSEARKKNKQEESPVDLLLASGLSKMCASLLTYPHEGKQDM